MSVGSAILMWAYILSKPLDANDFRVNEVMTLRFDRYKKKYCKKRIQFFLAIDSEPSKPLSSQIQCTASAIKGFPMHADRSMVRESSIEKSKLRDLLLCKTQRQKETFWSKSTIPANMIKSYAFGSRLKDCWSIGAVLECIDSNTPMSSSLSLCLLCRFYILLFQAEL